MDDHTAGLFIGENDEGVRMASLRHNLESRRRENAILLRNLRVIPKGIEETVGFLERQIAQENAIFNFLRHELEVLSSAH